MPVETRSQKKKIDEESRDAISPSTELFTTPPRSLPTNMPLSDLPKADIMVMVMVNLDLI
jgi:hypothetical protein